MTRRHSDAMDDAWDDEGGGIGIRAQVREAYSWYGLACNNLGQIWPVF